MDAAAWANIILILLSKSVTFAGDFNFFQLGFEIVNILAAIFTLIEVENFR
jgi:hypothetical protein